MEIQSRVGDDYTTFDIRGRLDAVSASQAEAALNDAIEAGASRLVVNLAGLEYISSAGLRVVLATAKRLSRRDGKMVLCELQSGIREVFAMSGLLSILSVAESEATAHSLVMA